MEKEVLKKAMDVVKPAVPSKEIIENSASFIFKDDTMIAFDGDICISHPLEGFGVEGSVFADDFYKLISKMKGDNLRIEREDNEILLKAGRMRAGIRVRAEIDLPLNSFKSKRKWKSVPKDFIEAMRIVVGSCSKDMTEPIMTGIHLNEDGFVEGTDGYQITRYEFQNKLPIRTTLIRYDLVAKIVTLNPIKVSDSDPGWIHFTNEEGSVVSCRIFDETKFPNTKKVLDFEGLELDLPKTLLDAIERSEIFAKRDFSWSDAIDFTLAKNRIIVHSDSETGWFEETLNVRYSGEEVNFGVTPYLLKNVLKSTTSCILGDDRIKFNGEQWSFVALLTKKI